MKRVILSILKFIKNLLFSIRFVVMLVFVVCIFASMSLVRVWLTRDYLNREIDKLQTELTSRGYMLAAEVNRKDYLTNPRNDSVNTQIDQIAYTYTGRIVIVTNTYKVVRDTYAEVEGRILVTKEVNNAFRGISTVNYIREEGNVELGLPIYGNDGKTIKGVILITAPDAVISEQTVNIDRTLRMITDIIFVVSLLFVFLFSYILTRPIHKMTESVKAITDGYLDTRLEDKVGFSELTKMSTQVNSMLDRLKTLDDSRQEFVSNVSHELKTPITSIKVLAESLNGEENVPVELYKEFMQDIVDEIDRENKIINDLLTLVRMDKTAAELSVTPLSMNDLVEHVLKRLKPIAAEKNIELVLESFRPVVAEVDEVKISLVVTNLVENAIKYNVANGWVRVSLNADHKYFYLTVADSGIGIPKESRELIFERFYRVDKARSRQTGGTGLGLSITKNVIAMHKGMIKVYSREGEGSTFTVRIPLKYTKA